MAHGGGRRPAYSSMADLLRDLDQQGFVVKETSDGYMVQEPDGRKRQIAFHASVLDSVKNRGYKNMIAGLKRIGFLTPDLIKQRATVPVNAVPMEYPDAVLLPDVEPVVLPELELEHIGEKKIRVPRGVSIRHVEEIQEMVDAAEELKVASDRMLVGYKTLYKRYTEQKRRLDKIEEQLGKVIQHL